MVWAASQSLVAVDIDAEVRGEHHDAAAAQAVAYFARLSQQNSGIAGDGPQCELLRMQRRPAAHKVGDATFGDDMVTSSHRSHRR